MLEQVRKARMKPLPPTIMGHGVFAVVCMVDHKEENPWDKPIHLHNARSRNIMAGIYTFIMPETQQEQ